MQMHMGPEGFNDLVYIYSGLNIPQSEEFYVFFRFFLLTKQVTLESE